jgi:hypothetical protein
MIRCDSHSFIFLRVPKNASSSVSQWLAKNYVKAGDAMTEVNDGAVQAQGIDVGELRKKYKVDSHWIHMTLQELYDERIVTQQNLLDYKTIAIVRNPYHRQISLYYFLCRLKKQTASATHFREAFKQGKHHSDTNNAILQSSYTIVNGKDYGTWWDFDNIPKHITEFENEKGKATFALGNLKYNAKAREEQQSMALYDQKTKDAVREYFDKDFELYNRIAGTKL